MADEPETIDEAILQSALEGIRRVSTGNVSIEGHSLRELLEAKKVIDSEDPIVTSLPRRGLRYAVQNPPGGGG